MCESSDFAEKLWFRDGIVVWLVGIPVKLEPACDGGSIMKSDDRYVVVIDREIERKRWSCGTSSALGGSLESRDRNHLTRALKRV